jgi:hypothetical protein
VVVVPLQSQYKKGGRIGAGYNILATELGKVSEVEEACLKGIGVCTGP